MIICPKCQFENPKSNKFCQRCGTSLQDKKCPECDAPVNWGAQTCSNCGAFTGTVRWAITSQSLLADPPVTAPTSESPHHEESEVIEETETLVEHLEESELPSESLSSDDLVEKDEIRESEITQKNQSVEGEDPIVSSASETTEASENHLEDGYLDANRRYRIHSVEREDIISEETGDKRIWRGKVVDLQPLQQSQLKEALETQARETSEEKPAIPTLAQPYRELESTFSQIVPKLYDAWEDSEKAVVILEDRSDWSLLSEELAKEDVPFQQILYCFNEMLQLWQELSPKGYGQSVLEIQNLCIDEDQSLCLRQLYADPPSETPKLEDLGKVWQKLLGQSEKTLNGSLLELMRDLAEGEISNPKEARSRLASLAQDLDESEDFTIDSSDSSIDDDDLPSTDLLNPPTSPEEEDEEELPTVMLPMQILNLSDAGLTDVGMQRHHNEDYFGIQTQVNKQQNNLGTSLQAKGLYIVCDGMGGHSAGEVASAMTVESLHRYFQFYWQEDKELPDENTIIEGILQANQEVYEVNQKNASSGSGRMGTTLVMALVQDTQVAIAHVGDSRIYKCTRKGGLEQLTTDHEVGQREIQRGVNPEVAYERPDAYQLTQAMGPRDQSFIDPDVQFLEINEDTLLLLCSDGLSDNDLLEEYYSTYLTPLISSSANLNQGLQELIDFANEYNGHDNITAIIIRIKVRPNLEQEMSF